MSTFWEDQQLQSLVKDSSILPDSSISLLQCFVVAMTLPVAWRTDFDDLDNRARFSLAESAFTREATTSWAHAEAVCWEAAINSSNLPLPQIILSAVSLMSGRNKVNVKCLTLFDRVNVHQKISVSSHRFSSRNETFRPSRVSLVEFLHRWGSLLTLVN